MQHITRAIDKEGHSLSHTHSQREKERTVNGERLNERGRGRNNERTGNQRRERERVRLHTVTVRKYYTTLRSLSVRVWVLVRFIVCGMDKNKFMELIFMVLSCCTFFFAIISCRLAVVASGSRFAARVYSFDWFSLSKKPFQQILAFATGFVFTIGVRWFYGYYFSTLHTHTFLWLMIIFFVCECIDNSSFFMLYALTN